MFYCSLSLSLPSHGSGSILSWKCSTVLSLSLFPSHGSGRFTLCPDNHPSFHPSHSILEMFYCSLSLSLPSHVQVAILDVLLFSLSLSLLMVQVAFISSHVRATFYLQSHLQQFRYTCPICQSLNSLVQNLAKMGKRHGLSTQTTCQRKQHRLWQYEAHTKHTYSFLVPVKRSWANLCRSPLPDSTQLKASSPEDELQQPEWQSTMCVRAAVHSYTNFSSSSAGRSSQSQHRQAHTHTHTRMHIHTQRKNSRPSSTQKLKICTH